MPRQPEGRLTKQIRAYLESRGALAVKIHGGEDPFQEVGITDLLVCYRGYFLALEVKMPGEEPSKVQKLFMRRVVEAGGIARVVRSVEDVRWILADLRRKR